MKLKKMKNVYILLALVVFLLLIGCGNSKSNNKNSSNEALSWSSEPPEPPSALNGQYRHIRYDFTYPQNNMYGTFNDSGWMNYYGGIENKLAISENGSRVVYGLNMIDSSVEYAINDQKSGIYVFSPENNTPLWSYMLTGKQHDFPAISSVDITRDGRGIIAFNNTGFLGELLYFECDNNEPKWVWKSSEDKAGYGDNHDSWCVTDMAFSADGDSILLVVNEIYTPSLTQNILVFRRNSNVPVQRITLNSINYIQSAISGDGNRIAVMTFCENPDDLAGDNFLSYDTSYSHSRVMLYENGKLKWSKWIMHECKGCEITSKPLYADVAISTDGKTVIAAGPGGKVVSLDGDSGNIKWFHESTTTFLEDIIPSYLDHLQISDDAKKISIDSSHGILYFDAEKADKLQWRTKDKMREVVDLSPNNNPSPNGFSVYMEEPKYTGFYEIPIFSNPHLSMSKDGNVMVICDGADVNEYNQQNGHIYALYYGSPLPFQAFAEDELNKDSDFIATAISGNGAYMAGIAWDEDESDGYSYKIPRITLHMFEIPPGLIMDIQTNATLSISSNDSIIDSLDDFTGSGDITVERHLVKPGHGAALFEDHTLVDELGAATIKNCISLNPLDWFSDDKDRNVTWSDGFHCDSSIEQWNTPSCITGVAQTISEMILMSELKSSTGVLLDQYYGSYLNVNIIVTGE